MKPPLSNMTVDFYDCSGLFLVDVKGVDSDYILIPRAQPEVVQFLVSNESPYFSHYESEISPSDSM